MVNSAAERAWRIGMGFLSLPPVAGVLLGITLVAEDSSHSGEMFDGLGTAVGTAFIVYSVVILVGAAAIMALARRNQVAAAMVSAVLPALVAWWSLGEVVLKVGRDESLASILVAGAVGALSVGWIAFCGASVRWAQ